MKETIIADLDGTVLRRWEPGDWLPRPGPVTCAQAILTNQGGLALRWAGFPWARVYPDLRQVLTRVRAGMARSGARIALIAAYHPKQRQSLRGRMLALVGRFLPPIPIGGGIWLALSPCFRKPAAGGLRWLMRRVPDGDFVFVGDEESDAAAAAAAGVRFRHAQEE